MRLTFLLGLLLLVACSSTASQLGGSRSAPHPDNLAAIPFSPQGKGQLPALIKPAEVRPYLEAASPVVGPVLLPTSLPQAGLEARVFFDRGFQVYYWQPGAEMWSVAIGVGGGPDPVRMLEKPSRSFRGVAAIYVHGYDRSDHITMEWDEGSTNGPIGYSISAYGLSDAEFAHLSASLSDR